LASHETFANFAVKNTTPFKLQRTQRTQGLKIRENTKKNVSSAPICSLSGFLAGAKTSFLPNFTNKTT